MLHGVSLKEHDQVFYRVIDPKRSRLHLHDARTGLTRRQELLPDLPFH